MIVVYDLEQFKNYHSCFAIDINSGQEYFFEISDFQDDSVAYYNWLSKCKGMIGFNNLAYDYPLLEAFIKLFKQGYRGGELARLLYKEGQKIIKDKWGIPEWKVKIPQRDLFKIYHFDNLAKSTSLKALQVAMKWHNVQDLPFKFDHHVGSSDRDNIKSYNRNDVLSTLEFYKKSKKVIDLRRELGREYKINCMNWNDAKIGEQLFLTMLSKKKRIPKHVLKKQRTYRDEINLSECLVDYKIVNSEVQHVVDTVFNKKVTKTKGAINHRLVYKGMPYDFGTGGIHGFKGSNVYKPNDKQVIMSSDVKSYYPNLSIQYRFYPLHLGEDFCDVYSDIYQLKTDAEHQGLKDQRAMAKLALNAAYGKSGDKYSCLYDPKYTLTTTVSGQILLTDLCISLQKEGFEAIMINTK